MKFKFVQNIALTLLIVCVSITLVSAQINMFPKKYKEEVVQTLSKLMNDHYVFPDVAKKTETHLVKLLNDGHFDQYISDDTFAVALTEAVQFINKDKHMRIKKNRPFEAPQKTPERMIEEQLDNLNRTKTYNAGFHNVKILEGIIGYLDLRGFAYVKSGKLMADAYMKLMSNSDAIIIDLSKNGGGDPAMVQYLCSYFFEGDVHLNSLYFREGDRTIDFLTHSEVEGEKMIDIPLFVITGPKTFSGAEEFSYNMQTQKRATLVGQTTGGGANPGRTMQINDSLNVFIPGGMAINPITKTNWEGVGVIPEYKTEPDEALDKAHALAKEAAEKYRKETKEKYTKMYMELISHLETYEKGQSEEKILNALSKCKTNCILQEWQINMMGYDYLIERKKAMIAQSIFRANTILFPNSANVFDSYAEALMTNGDLHSAQKNYQIAVNLATKNENPDIELFKKNLKAIQDKIAGNK